MSFFGIQGIEARTLHNYIVDGEERSSFLVLSMCNEEGDKECSVIFFIDEPENVILENWNFTDETEAANGQLIEHWGFFVPESSTLAENVGISEACESWDDEVYGPLWETIIPHNWGVGFGNLRIDVEEDIMGDDMSDSFYRELYDDGTLLGGSWSSTLWDPTTWASHTATASPVEEWVLDVDDEGRIIEYYTAAEILSAPGLLPDGVYSLQPLYVWPFEAFFSPR